LVHAGEDNINSDQPEIVEGSRSRLYHLPATISRRIVPVLFISRPSPIRNEMWQALHDPVRGWENMSAVKHFALRFPSPAA
jgi:hypothetical protein